MLLAMVSKLKGMAEEKLLESGIKLTNITNTPILK